MWTRVYPHNICTSLLFHYPVFSFAFRKPPYSKSLHIYILIFPPRPWNSAGDDELATDHELATDDELTDCFLLPD